MDAKSIANQARERARIALEQAKLQTQEQNERKRQEEVQRERSDYPDLLRAKVIAGLTVKKTGDYTDDLAAFQKGMQEFVGYISDALLLSADSDVLSSFFHHTVNMLSVVPQIPGHLLTGTTTDEQLKPYIDTVLQKNLRARTYSILIAEPEIRQRIFDTCAPIGLDARLNTLASEIQRQSATPDDVEGFQARCRTSWMTCLDQIEEVNQLGYIQSGGVYIIRDLERNNGFSEGGLFGNSPVRTTDPVYEVTQMITHVGEKRVHFIDRLKPIMAVLTSLAASLEALPPDSIAEMKKRFYLEDSRSLLGHLVNKLEEFGVWSTNQCIDGHSHSYYLGELVEPLLDAVKAYAAQNPMAGTSILFHMSESVASTWGYNCPEESLTNNSREPEFQLKLLVAPAVVEAFAGDHDLGWILTQFSNLFTLCRRYVGWRGRDLNYWWRAELTPAEIEKLWIEHRDDEAFWKENKGQESA